jgi:hypothetical protein
VNLQSIPNCQGLLLLITSAAVLAAFGCANPRQAVRPAALIVIDQLDAHERELDAQIAAEDEFYRGLTRVLAEDARREVIVEQGNAMIEDVDSFGDQVLLESNGVSVGATVKFLRSDDEKYDGFITANMQQEAEAKARAAATFTKIAYRREKIATAHETLLALIRPVSVRDQVKWWAEYGSRVKKEFDELNKPPGDSADYEAFVDQALAILAPRTVTLFREEKIMSKRSSVSGKKPLKPGNPGSGTEREKNEPHTGVAFRRRRWELRQPQPSPPRLQPAALPPVIRTRTTPSAYWTSPSPL